MQILVQCPYCGEGKVRVPESAIGLTVVCRYCSSCFTIAPASLMPAHEPAPIEASASTCTSNTDAARSAQTALTILATIPEDHDARSRAGTGPESASSTADPGFVPALIAISLGGVGLAISQLPYGRFGTTGLGLIGMVFALAALLIADRKRQFPAIAVGVNGLAILLAVFLPEWLGLSSWKPVRLPDESKMVRAVGIRDGLAMPADWVDVTKAAWQRDDVRVGVSSFSIAPIELVGPKEQRRWTKESYVQVRVRVENAGVARTINVSGWPESPTLDGPKLTDSAGKALAMKVFPEGWTPAEKRKLHKVLFPGRSTEQLLIFESPGKTAGDLMLELPGSAFGGTESARLLLPR